MSGSSDREFIAAVYRVLLGREPDPSGAAYYSSHLSQTMTHAQVLESVGASEEFRARFGDAYSVETDPHIQSALTPSVRSLSARLAEHSISRARFDADWLSLFAGGADLMARRVPTQIDYIEKHKDRFFELLNAMAILLAGKAHASVVEFGLSSFSAMYKRYFPGIRLTTVDRPVAPDYPGFTAENTRAITGCDQHIELDLTNPTQEPERQLAAAGPFDLLIFTEILEHLDVNPVALFTRLLSLLSPTGHLYLTTPNFFSHDHLARVSRRQNPQQVFPAAHDNWDAHHHHREYCMSELLEFIVEAGGQIEAVRFSDCWDPPSLRPTLDKHPDQAGNLVLVAKRAV